jgi:hypothetical protein
MSHETKLDTMKRNAEDAARRHAAQRSEESPEGMRLTARGLRLRAEDMRDPRDRDTMLRLAADYERRALALEKVINSREK